MATKDTAPTPVPADSGDQLAAAKEREAKRNILPDQEKGLTDQASATLPGGTKVTGPKSVIDSIRSK